MKRILLFLFSLVCCLHINAQISSYTFAATSSTYTPLVGGTAVATILDDDINSGTIPLGFTFTYNGNPYTSVTANSNGWLSFATTPTTNTSTQRTNSLASSSTGLQPILSPLWDDLMGTPAAISGGVPVASYLTTGSPGSSVFTFEWLNWAPYSSSTIAATLSFQVKLYEATGVVEFYYRQEGGTAAFSGASIGIAAASTNFISLTGAGTSPTTSTVSSTNSITARPATGQKYTFTPPAPCNGTPVAGTPNATLFNICPTSTAAITVTGYTTGASGLSLQWEQSADGSTGWANVAGGSGATTATYTTAAYAGVDVYYRMRITCSNGGGTSVTATIKTTGPVIPTTQASSIVSSTATNTSITPSWTNGNGNNRLVYMNSTNSFADPLAAPGTAVTTWANAGQQLVYNGTATSVTVTGLAFGTSYYFRVYEGNKCGTTYYNNVNTAASNPTALGTANYLKYTVAHNTGIVYTPVSGSATTLNTAGNASSGVWDDVNFGAITFFPFTYAGITVNQFRAVSNGFMTLNNTNTNTAYQNGITNAAGNNMILAPFYEDLYITATGEYVKYEITGVTPNRVLTVQWENVEIYNYPGPSLNFQVKLYEADSHIEYVYGVMQGFDGTNPINATVTNGYVFSYTTGLTATAWSTPAIAGEALILQQANSTSFTSEGGVSTNEGFNKLSVMPDCYSKYSFTPSGSVRANDTYPGVPTAPINDEPAGAITLTPLPSVPADLCGSFYTTAFATPTTGVAAEIASTLADDDVWFKFTANSTNTTISLRGSGGYDAAMQLFAGTDLNTVLAQKNANGLTGTSLTETINQTDFATTIGIEYYIRVYHAGGGTQATATATVLSGVITGFTVNTPGTGYITATTANSGTGATPFVYITDASGSGAVAKATVSGGAITGIAIQNSQGGTGYTSPTVTIAPSSFGLTGDFSIIVNATPPPVANDDIAGAIDLVAGNSCVTTAGTTIGATASAQAVCGGIADDDVWYKWTIVSPSDMLTVQSGAGFNAHVEVFSSSDNTATGTLTSLGCFNGTGVAGAEVLTGTGLTVGNTFFIRVYHSASGSGGGTFTICLVNVPTWTGANSTTWGDAGNWSPAGIPTSSNSVSIPNVTNKPVLASGTNSVNNITIQSGSLAIVNGTGKLQVAGIITSTGLLDATAGTIELNGSAAQTLSGTLFTGNLQNLIVSNTSGVTLTAALPVTGSVSFGSVSNATLASAGFLTLISNASGTARIADITNAGANTGNAISGDVIAQKYIVGGGLSTDAPSSRAYRFFAHPFSSAITLSQLQTAIDITGTGTGFDFSTSGSPSAFTWSQATANGAINDLGWAAVTSTAASWNQYQGARIFYRGAKGTGLTGSTYTVGNATLSMTGPVNTGNKTVNLTYPNTGTTSNFNFVGNPYASNVQMSGVSHTNTASAYYVWNLGLGARGSYSTVPFGSSYVLPAYAGLFVATNAASGSVVFHESDKTASTATNALSRNLNTDKLVMQLNSGNLQWDELQLGFDAQFKTGMEYADAMKLLNPDVSFYSISSDNTNLAIDKRNIKQGDIVPLGLISGLARSFTLQVNELSLTSGVDLYLHDKFTGTEQLLETGMLYNFSTTADAASQGNSRFELVAKQAPVPMLIATSFAVRLSPNPATGMVKVSFSNQEKANTVISIVNAEGKTVRTVNAGNVQTGDLSISLKGLARGSYYVTLNNGTENKTEKLQVQ